MDRLPLCHLVPEPFGCQSEAVGAAPAARTRNYVLLQDLGPQTGGQNRDTGAGRAPATKTSDRGLGPGQCAGSRILGRLGSTTGGCILGVCGSLVSQGHHHRCHLPARDSLREKEPVSPVSFPRKYESPSHASRLPGPLKQLSLGRLLPVQTLSSVDTRWVCSPPRPTLKINSVVPRECFPSSS